MENFESYVEMCKDVIAYYKRVYRYLGESAQDDINQECLMAIHHALTLYKENLGSFKSYASNWIKTYVYDYINQVESPVSISRESNRKIRRIRACISENPNITIDKIATLTGYSKDVVLTYYQGFKGKSLNSKLDSEGEVELSDTIADNSYIDRNKILIREELMNRISAFLSNEDKDLIFKSFGIEGEKVSQSRLAASLGISHQAVSKKINSIIKRLHEELGSEGSLYLLYKEMKSIVFSGLIMKKSKITNSIVAYASL